MRWLACFRVSLVVRSITVLFVVVAELLVECHSPFIEIVRGDLCWKVCIASTLLVYSLVAFLNLKMYYFRES